MSGSKKIPLFYWSEIRFIFKKKENYGDLLSKYLVEKISGREVKWINPRKQAWYSLNKKHYLAIGSILHHASNQSIVWGSGIIDRKHDVPEADFRAVRGPQTRKFLNDLDIFCPEVYGDPALLLPRYFNPQIEKKYKIGIIPHYHDYNFVDENFKGEKDVLVVDLMTMDVEEVTRQLLECEKTISSSLHGLIVSHAYGIPSIWVKFSDKIFGDGIKYRDYLESVDVPFYEAFYLEEEIQVGEIEKFFDLYPSLPSNCRVEELCEGLMRVCPFNSILDYGDY